MLKGIDIWEEKLPNQLCSITKLPEAAKSSEKEGHQEETEFSCSGILVVGCKLKTSIVQWEYN